MAIQFIVEDGTGLHNATSYITVAELDQYFENNGWDLTVFEDDAEKQIYLNRCTSYIDTTYQFSGYVVDIYQSLQWPRYAAEYDMSNYSYNNYVPNNIVPKEVKSALATIVYFVKSGFVSLDEGFQNGKGAIKRESKSIEGALSVEYEYFNAGTNSFRITEVDRVLSKISKSASKVNGVNSLIRGCE